MDWGHQIGYLESLRETLGRTPPALLNKPEQHELGGEFYTAFNTLSSSRNYGMGGPLPISLPEMWAYCQMFEITGLDHRADFVHTIQKLDKQYLDIVAKRNAITTKSEVVNPDIPADNPPRG